MLEGNLVRLRAPEIGDAERGYHWINDPEVARFLDVRYPISMVTERQLYEERYIRPQPDAVYFAIETKDGVHIGTVSLRRIDREDGTAEMGIVIGEKDSWDKGYGTNAVATLLDFAFNQMNLHRVWLTIWEFNKRAIACFKKCGFKEEGVLRQHHYGDGRYWDAIMMGVLREDFVRPQAPPLPRR